MKHFPPAPFSSLAVVAALLGGIGGSAPAASPDRAPVSDPSPESQLASFVVHPDFEVSLYADESLGIANPVAIQWDPQGRLWVLCTLAYAQLQPGETPDDKLFILEDSNGDGRADRSILFADGLNMPMGFALGHGGAWVAADSELLFLRDTDGDGRADERRVVLSGFGTGDTHQNISNLVFDAGGFLYFTQGLHAFSQVETPWGVSRGDSAGFWRFDPRLMRLDPFGFPSMASQNPCGAALDRWGALFIKSNGPHLCFAMPGLVPTRQPRELMQFAQVGQTPGKSMGVDIVSSAHLPGWIDDHAVIAGYFAREVSAIPLVEEGAGFAASLPVQLVYGGHESFRPVDVRQGPDGAVYIADWFNPIINHYQVSLRHPDRDYDHGRIWRLAAKGSGPKPRSDLAAMDLGELLGQLRNPERWPREQARRLLSDHPDPDAVVAATREAVAALEPEESVALVEAAGVLESLGAVDAALLDRLEASAEPRVRALVGRILARAVDPADPVYGASTRLARLLADPHPRPRLEAVIACANLPDAGSLWLAAAALDAGEDRFVEYSLAQAVFALEQEWLPELRKKGSDAVPPAHLAFVLETYGGEVSAGIAREALAREMDAADRVRLLAVLARLGGPADLELAYAEACALRDAGLLARLAEAAASGRPGPSAPDPEKLRPLLADPDATVSVAAIRLAGLWRIAGLAGALDSLVRDGRAPLPQRREAVESLARVAGADSLPLLQSLLEDPSVDKTLRERALAAIALFDPAAAAERLVGLLADTATESRDAEGGLVSALLAAKGGSAALAAAFESGDAPDEATAETVLAEASRLGLADSELSKVLHRALGRDDGAPDYDAELVAAVVAAVRAGKGDPQRGAEIYRKPQLACTACHGIGDEGGVVGPPLDAVGAGLPLDQIVESILWPDRQIKEGYEAVFFRTKAGASITGYVERESDDIVFYRNSATPWIVPLAKKDILERRALPSLMPARLTDSLDEDGFLDLVAYLASLKG